MSTISLGSSCALILQQPKIENYFFLLYKGKENSRPNSVTCLWTWGSLEGKAGIWSLVSSTSKPTCGFSATSMMHSSSTKQINVLFSGLPRLILLVVGWVEKKSSHTKGTEDRAYLAQVSPNKGELLFLLYLLVVLVLNLQNIHSLRENSQWIPHTTSNTCPLFSLQRTTWVWQWPSGFWQR